MIMTVQTQLVMREKYTVQMILSSVNEGGGEVHVNEEEEHEEHANLQGVYYEEETNNVQAILILI